MDLIFAALSFAGYIALLLWGVHMVQTGMQRVYGAALGATLARALGTRVRGFVAGIAITAALQSSTAAGLMITGLAAGGAMTLVPGLAAMLGANVGTTLMVQVLSFDPTPLAPVLILLGVWLFRRNAPGSRRDSGRIFIGLGLLLTALHQLVTTFETLQDAPLVALLLQHLSTQPAAAVLFAAALTWLAHTTVAVVILVMSLAMHGVASLELAYALVLGANLGAAITPLLEGAGSWGARDANSGTAHNPAVRRLPVGNVLIRGIGVVLGLLLMPWVLAWIDQVSSDSARAVANMHTLFNLGVALLFLPILTPCAKLLTRWLPNQTNPDDPGQPQYLDASAHDVPAVALGNAAREALRMADMLQTLLQYARASLRRDKRQRHVQARQLDHALNRLKTALIAYLAQLDHETMTVEDHRRLNDVLTFATHVGRAADVAYRGLLTRILRMKKQGRAFSAEQIADLDAAFSRLIRNHRQCAALFVAEDVHTARMLVMEKTWFRQQEIEATVTHMRHIKHGDPGAAEAGSLYLDLRRALQTVNANLIAATAYPQLARHGELLNSRVRGDASQAVDAVLANPEGPAGKC